MIKAQRKERSDENGSDIELIWSSQAVKLNEEMTRRKRKKRNGALRVGPNNVGPKTHLFGASKLWRGPSLQK
jgi:hypothetical protein